MKVISMLQPIPQGKSKKNMLTHTQRNLSDPI